ncbi:MAG: hypothetical protein GY862_21890 [Gammaproteobacteria bacterium]|nr:hypothetical protein [Gammaproteobacteria bacterium]
MNCRCCGRDFGIEEIELVRSLIAEAPARAELSRLTCLDEARRVELICPYPSRAPPADPPQIHHNLCLMRVQQKQDSGF